MGLSFLKRLQKPQIGLDITPEGITAVLLGKKNNTVSLHNYAYEPFTEEVIQNGLIVNSTVFIETLKKIFDSQNFESGQVNIAMPGNVTFIKTITLPDLPADELAVIVPQEAEKHIPFALDEVNIDFAVLEGTRKQSDSGKKVDVVLVALSKSIVKNYTDHIYSADVSVNSVDIAPFAMIRTLANGGIIDESDSIYLSVLIGHENTDINVVSKGMPLFSNSTPIGKKNIIDSLSNILEINASAVEKMLPDIALIIPGMNVENMDPQLSKAAAAVRNIYNNVSSEIQKNIEFFYSQNAESKEIKKIIVGGSGVCIQNIDKYIANRLKIDTVLCNSLDKISNDFNSSENLISPLNIPALATGVGLALKGM